MLSPRSSTSGSATSASQKVTWKYVFVHSFPVLVSNALCKGFLIGVLWFYQRKESLDKVERRCFNTISIGLCALLSIGIGFLFDHLGMVLRSHFLDRKKRCLDSEELGYIIRGTLGSYAKIAWFNFRKLKEFNAVGIIATLFVLGYIAGTFSIALIGITYEMQQTANTFNGYNLTRWPNKNNTISSLLPDFTDDFSDRMLEIVRDPKTDHKLLGFNSTTNEARGEAVYDYRLRAQWEEIGLLRVSTKCDLDHVAVFNPQQPPPADTRYYITHYENKDQGRGVWGFGFFPSSSPGESCTTTDGNEPSGYILYAGWFGLQKMGSNLIISNGSTADMIETNVKVQVDVMRCIINITYDPDLNMNNEALGPSALAAIVPSNDFLCNFPNFIVNNDKAILADLPLDMKHPEKLGSKWLPTITAISPSMSEWLEIGIAVAATIQGLEGILPRMMFGESLVTKTILMIKWNRVALLLSWIQTLQVTLVLLIGYVCYGTLIMEEGIDELEGLVQGTMSKTEKEENKSTAD